MEKDKMSKTIFQEYMEKSKMSKTRVIEMLKQLPILEPKVEEVRELFPHLTAGEISDVLTLEEGKYSKSVAVPPLRVDGAFQIVSFEREYKRDDGTVIPVRLRWSYSGRKNSSTKYAHSGKAVDFARENWGSDLVEDTWEDYTQIILDDPTNLHQSGYSKGSPKTKAVVRFTTNRPWNDIINDHSKPESQVIDDAIAEMTTSYLVGQELKGSRGGYSDFNCAYDGAGLGLSGCGECGNRFRDNQFRSGWFTPLPSKLADLLISEGFKFGQDPVIAREKEAQLFYKQAKTL